MRRPALLLLLLAVVALVGCGGGNGSSDTADVNQLAKQIRSMKPGEILIRGLRPTKFSGPYIFRRSYIVTFTQGGTPRHGRRSLSVSLESHRGSGVPPYQLLIKTGKSSGSARLARTGKFWVHVTTTSPEYVLRFTPAKPGPR